MLLSQLAFLIVIESVSVFPKEKKSHLDNKYIYMSNTKYKYKSAEFQIHGKNGNFCMMWTAVIFLPIKFWAPASIVANFMGCSGLNTEK